jgi:hypothetical protein
MTAATSGLRMLFLPLSETTFDGWKAKQKTRSRRVFWLRKHKQFSEDAPPAWEAALEVLVLAPVSTAVAAGVGELVELQVEGATPAVERVEIAVEAEDATPAAAAVAVRALSAVAAAVVPDAPAAGLALSAVAVEVVPDVPAAGLALPAVAAEVVPDVPEAGPACSAVAAAVVSDVPAVEQGAAAVVRDGSQVGQVWSGVGPGDLQAAQGLRLVGRGVLAEPADGSPADRALPLVGRGVLAEPADGSPVDRDGCRAGRLGWGAGCRAAPRWDVQRQQRQDGPYSGCRTAGGSEQPRADFEAGSTWAEYEVPAWPPVQTPVAVLRFRRGRRCRRRDCSCC